MSGKKNRPPENERYVEYDDQMLSDLERWKKEDPDAGARVVSLIECSIANPKHGPGRPKKFGGLRSVWSRRITKSHRLFYVAGDGLIRFLSCHGHELDRSLLNERSLRY